MKKFLVWALLGTFAAAGVRAANVMPLFMYDTEYSEKGSIVAAFLVESATAASSFTVDGIEGVQVGAFNGRNQVFLVKKLKCQTTYQDVTWQTDGEEGTITFTTPKQTKIHNSGAYHGNTKVGSTYGASWSLKEEDGRIVGIDVHGAETGSEAQLTVNDDGWSFTSSDPDKTEHFVWPEVESVNGRDYVVLRIALRAKAPLASAPTACKLAVSASLGLGTIAATAARTDYGLQLQGTGSGSRTLGVFCRPGQAGALAYVDRDATGRWFGAAEALGSHLFDNISDEQLDQLGAVDQASVAVSWHDLDLSDGNIVKLSITLGVFDATTLEEDAGSLRVSYTAKGWDGPYDGKAHGITVTVREPEDAKPQYALSKDGPYRDEPYAFTDVDETPVDVWFRLEAEGYATVTNSARVVIRREGGEEEGGEEEGEEPGSGDVPAGGLSRFDVTATYDGHGHVIDTNGLTAAYRERVANPPLTYSLAKDGPWTAEASSFTNVGDHVCWYRYGSADNPNVKIFKHQVKVTIVPRTVKFTSGTQSWPYDGQAHSNVTVSVTGTFAAGEGLVASGFPTITEAGEIKNAFSCELRLNPGSVAENYAVTCETGTLTVSKVDNVWMTEPTVVSKTWDGTPAAVTMGTPKFGIVKVTYDKDQESAPTKRGLHTAVFAVAETASYGPLTKRVEYEIFRNLPAPEDDPDPTDPTVNPDDPAQRGAPDVKFSKFDFSGTYDGDAHTVNERELKDAYGRLCGGAAAVAYGSTAAGPWTDEAPTFTNACVAAFWYCVRSANYEDIVRPCKVVIAKRPVTLMSGTKLDFEYDGQPHAYTNLVVTAGGFVSGEGIATSNWATVTEVEDGSVDNAFDCSPLGGTRLENYDLTVVTGKIAVVRTVPPMLDPSAWGTVSYPTPMKGSAYLKTKTDARWRAKAADACVFAGWEWTNGAPDSSFLLLSENERRKPTLKLKIAGQVRPADVGAVWTRIDDDRIRSVELTASNLAVVCRSHVTAQVIGLPCGMKFNRKTLAITGTPKKDVTKAVKVRVRNGSGYSWNENWIVATRGGKVDQIERVTGSCLKAGAPVMLWGDATLGKVKGSKVYVVGKKASLQAMPAKGSIFLGWYEDPWFEHPASWLPKGYLAASQSLVVSSDELHLFARFVELREWAVGTFDGVFYDADTNGNGTVKFTVSTKGKVSGRMLKDGKGYAFSAPMIDDVRKTEDGGVVFVAHPSIKVNGATGLMELVIGENANLALGGAEIAYGNTAEALFARSVQNGWRLKSPLFPSFPSGKAALMLETPEGLALKFGAKGVVTVAGTLGVTRVSATTQVLPVVWTDTEYRTLAAQVCVCVAPKRGLSDGFRKVYNIVLKADVDEKGKLVFKDAVLGFE